MNLRILRIFEGTFSLEAAQILQIRKIMENERKRGTHLRSSLCFIVILSSYILNHSFLLWPGKAVLPCPANTQRRHNVVTTSLQRHDRCSDVVTALLWRCVLTGNVATTSLQRRCNVTTLQRRCNDVVVTSCVYWASVAFAKYLHLYLCDCMCLLSCFIDETEDPYANQTHIL